MPDIEHWKTEDQLRVLAIGGFKLRSMCCREEGHHGGSAIYARNGVKCNNRPKLNKLSVRGIFECSVIECQLGKVNVIVACIYRPPSSDMNIFLNKTEQLLVQIYDESKHVFIAGDFNIELIKDNKAQSDFLSIMNSFNFKPSIQTNTRVTNITASCIDNIFVNRTFLDTVVFENFVSDHMAQKIIFELNSETEKTPKYKRFYSDGSKDDFLCCLRTQDWLNVYDVSKNDINEQWSVFMNTYKNIFEQNFPLKLVTFNKQRNSQSIYNNPEIKECKSRLDTLLVLSRHMHTFQNTYNETKKEYDKLLLKSRGKYYENKIYNSDNKMKSMWAICNELTGKTNNCSDHEIRIKGNSEEIADNYNAYLLEIIPNLLKNLQDSHVNSSNVQNNKSMYLRPTTPNEICAFGKNIKNKNSSGIDEIPTSIVKVSIGTCKNILSYLINNSFRYGIFPDKLKIALIKPLYKKGDPEVMDNYRPISLLPGFSQLFELIIRDRLLNFMNECNLFCENQHGFLQGKSTQTAIFQFIKVVLEHLENSNLAMGMFLDLSRAYDCVDRELLIKKLKMYGIRGNIYKWLVSYLNGRFQTVSVSKHGKTNKSTLRESKFGIAQGSVLGPILFIIFVNDLTNSLHLAENIIKYADDTNLLIGGSKLNDVLHHSKTFLDTINNWFMQNILILNESKTNAIFFKTKQSKVETPRFFENGANSIAFSQQTKFLALYINECLDWSYHIECLLKKLGSICYGIRATSKYMNEKTVKILYFSNFQSVVQYGIIFWGIHSQTQSIFIIQKRLIRIIKKMNYLESCRSIFKNASILTVYGLYIYECLTFFFKNRHCFGTPFLHQYNTRTRNVTYPIHRLTLSEKSPHYMCLKLYNKLPDNIKTIQSLEVFKRELKKLLINLEPYSVDEFLDT